MRNIPAAAALALAVATGAGDARAWQKDEHEAIVGAAFRLACADYADALPECDAAGGAFAALASIAGRAAHDADTCHSFYFTDVAIDIQPADAEARRGCPIVDGAAFVDTSAWRVLGMSTYWVKTNANHFGQHAVRHMEHYRGLALEAARRYRAASGSTRDRCAAAAIGLAGYADHYMTDRTAAGHGITPDGALMSAAHYDERRVGMLGCLHGQSASRRLGVFLGTGFDCMDGGWVVTPRVWDGFGLSPRRFGGAFASGAPAWRGDSAWADVLADAGAQDQFDETVQGAESVFASVLGAMAGVEAPVHLTPTFLANSEACPVLWGQCCRSFTARAGANGSWADPDVRIEADCSYCAPDVTDVELKAACPARALRLAREDDGGTWKTVYGRSTWEAYHGWPRAGQPWTGKHYYEVALEAPAEGWGGNAVARTILAANEGQLHPDARWDADHDVVSLLGCAAP